MLTPSQHCQAIDIGIMLTVGGISKGCFLYRDVTVVFCYILNAFSITNKNNKTNFPQFCSTKDRSLYTPMNSKPPAWIDQDFKLNQYMKVKVPPLYIY